MFRKSDHAKENGFGESFSQKNNKRIQPDNSAITRNHFHGNSARGSGIVNS